jgi:hypothetical protein
MARHNRQGQGKDQHGHEYQVGFQPDWLHQVKVTRELENGRQSTKTLLRNPAPVEQSPGPKVRTQIEAEALGIDLGIELHDPRAVVRRVTVEFTVPDGPEQGEVVAVTLSRKRERIATTRPASVAKSGKDR